MAMIKAEVEVLASAWKAPRVPATAPIRYITMLFTGNGILFTGILFSTRQGIRYCESCGAATTAVLREPQNRNMMNVLVGGS